MNQNGFSTLWQLREIAYLGDMSQSWEGGSAKIHISQLGHIFQGRGGQNISITVAQLI